jgi:hypothetical protein
MLTTGPRDLETPITVYGRVKNLSKRTERSDLVCPVGGVRLGPAEHPVEHFTLRVANDR